MDTLYSYTAANYSVYHINAPSDIGSNNYGGEVIIHPIKKTVLILELTTPLMLLNSRTTQHTTK